MEVRHDPSPQGCTGRRRLLGGRRTVGSAGIRSHRARRSRRTPTWSAASSVTVDGSGFAPNSQVGYCQGIQTATPSPDNCDGVEFTTASATGTFRIQMPRAPVHLPTEDGLRRGEVRDRGRPTRGHPGHHGDRRHLLRSRTRVPPRPDARVRNRSTGEIYGDNVYSPLDAVTTRSHTISPGGTWTFAVQVQNDGPTDSFRISADGGFPFTVRYLSGYYDITATATGAGATLRNVAPGQVRTIAVEFRAAEDATPRPVTFVTVGFTSLTDGTSDYVQVGVRVPRST